MGLQLDNEVAVVKTLTNISNNPVYSYSKTNSMQQCLKFIIFAVTLCMFPTVFPSIVSSSRLYIQQQAYVKQRADC